MCRDCTGFIAGEGAYATLGNAGETPALIWTDSVKLLFRVLFGGPVGVGQKKTDEDGGFDDVSR